MTRHRQPWQFIKFSQPLVVGCRLRLQVENVRCKHHYETPAQRPVWDSELFPFFVFRGRGSPPPSRKNAGLDHPSSEGEHLRLRAVCSGVDGPDAARCRCPVSQYPPRFRDLECLCCLCFPTPAARNITTLTAVVGNRQHPFRVT